MPSLMRSSSSTVGGAITAATTTPQTAFSSVASQAAAINVFRSRLRSSSPASSVADTEEELDLSSASLLPPLAPSAAATVADHVRTPHGRHHACDSCSELETEFAAAVLFVETYNGAYCQLSCWCSC